MGTLVSGLGQGGHIDIVLSLCYNGAMDTGREIKINTRYPTDVYAALKQFAKEDGRSFHNLVIWILREYIKQRQAQGK